MIRSLLAGTKTQTRRVVRWIPGACGAVRLVRLIGQGTCCYLDESGRGEGLEWAPYSGSGLQPWPAERIGEVSPYGGPGDRLWCRETFAPRYFDDGRPGYRADWTSKLDDCLTDPKWKPSIFMKRADSRITLEVTDVRVERLHGITEEDARAEGVTSGRIPADDYGPERIGYVFGADDGKCLLHPTAREAFAVGWDSINGKRCAWASNPFVWRVSFRRVP